MNDNVYGVRAMKIDSKGQTFEAKSPNFRFGPVSGLLQIISVKLYIENVGLYLSITCSQGKFDLNCRLSEPIVGRSGFIRAGIEGIRASVRYL
jgi:hypothetical protein